LPEDHYESSTTTAFSRNAKSH